MSRILALLALVFAGCTAAAGVTPKHGDGLVQPRKVGPVADRCSSLADKGRAEECEQVRLEAIAQVRKLAVDDQVCLDGNPFSDGVTSRCKVRAFVEDVAPKSVKLEIRHADPGTGFEPMQDYWYHEDALVDLCLESRGFLKR
jgi:hypothetical protein